MKNLYLKCLFLGILTLFSIKASAYDCEVDGIYYNLNKMEKTASVTYSDYDSYSGSITIPSTFTYIGISYSVTNIESSAFTGCTDLTSVTIGNSVTNIESSAFAGCTGLTSVTIPNNVTSIDYAFDGCSNLKTVTINSNAVISEANSSFNYVFGSQVEKYILGDEVTSIGNYAFEGCSNLTSIVFPNSVTTIGEGAFYGCTGLASIDIPNNVKTIEDYAFYGCTGLTSVIIPNSITNLKKYVFAGCTNLKSIAIPGSVTSIESNAFEGCTGLTSVIIPDNVTSIESSAFSGCNNLKTVTINNNAILSEADSPLKNIFGIQVEQYILGDEVTIIGEDAFFGCTELVFLTIYTLTPPQLENNSFTGVSEGLVVYVMAASVSLYQNDPNWGRFIILPIQDDLYSLTVNFTNTVDQADYTNMWLELCNTINGQTMHYVLTDKISYTFNGIKENSVFDITLRNQYGDVFGKIDHILVDEQNKTVTFESLLKPHNVALIVNDPHGKDISKLCNISWHDENGEFLLQGNTIKGIPAGRILLYQISLPQNLATNYTLPTTSSYKVKDDNNTIVCQLTLIGKTQLSGIVKDANTNQPLSGATISVIQTYDNNNTKTLTAETNNQGNYSMEISSTHTTLTIAAVGYLSQTFDCTSFLTGTNNITMPDIKLVPITGAIIDLVLSYIPAHSLGEQPSIQSKYKDYNNMNYEIFNKSKNTTVDNFHVQYPQIVLLEDVSDGDVLEITASSRKDAFKPVKTTVTISEQRATASINIIEFGKINAKFNKNINPSVVGTLYDAEGKLVSINYYNDKSLIVSDIIDGCYKLITMGASEYFNSVYDLNQLSATGLQSGVDYAENAIVISSGIITPITISEVPFFDETKFYYTGEKTSFSVNKPVIVAGNYLTFRAKIDFKDEYKGKVNNVQIIVDLPESCSFFENSVMIDTSLGGYSVDGNRITIPIANYDNLVRFCAIPTLPGNFAPSAFIKFEYNGMTITQPIGNAIYDVEGLSSLIVPSTTASKTIHVGGTAYNNCKIDIYDNDVLIGHTSSNANSKWLIECELHQPFNLSVHNIYAKITTDEGIVLPTEIVTCTYNNSSVQISKVTQYNEQRGPTPYIVTWNFLNPSLSSQHYSYDMYDNHRKFSYTIEFSDNKAVTNVVLYVKTAKSGWWLLDAIYDEEKDVWVTSGEFGDSQNADLPINVGVNYKSIINEIRIENLVYAIANELDQHSSNSDDIPDLKDSDYTVTQDDGNTVVKFDELLIDETLVESITIGNDISMKYSFDGVDKNITMSYGGTNSLPQDVYEYKLNDTQSLFVINTSKNKTTEVCYYYPISMIKEILGTPYAIQSHKYDFFNELLEKAGSASFVFIKESLTQDRNFKAKVKATLDDVIENCPELEPMVDAMRKRQEHTAQLNEALDKFQKPFQKFSKLLGKLGLLAKVAEGGLHAGNQAIDVGQIIGTYHNRLHDYVYEAQFEAAGCMQRNDSPDPPYKYPGADQTFCIDPSGFVYEGVPSNRLEGVTATCYYKKTVEDMYGDQHEEVVLWDAERYGQKNPLLTDENGYYQWDVPVGMWQVKYEKEGYETTYSNWLPVPPPQLDVNIGMVQMRQPEVIKARAYPQAIEIEFDKYMLPKTLTTENISVTVNGTVVNGEIELLNAEVDNPNTVTSIRRAPGTGLTLSSHIRFNANNPFNANKVTLHIKKNVESYANLQMNEDYEAELDVEFEIESIETDSTVNVIYGETRQLSIAVLPAYASKGKTLTARTTSPMIATTDVNTYTLDNNGKAIINVRGDMPGMTSLLYGIDGYDITAATLINVMMKNQMQVETPTATIADGSVVSEGTTIYLRCATEGAVIYYTLDGSCPCDEATRYRYDGPITIASDVIVKAIAVKEGMDDSDVATFVYLVNGINSVLADNNIRIDSKDQTIIVTGAEGASCQIYDLQGRIATGRNHLTNQSRFKMKSAGIYLLHITLPNGKTASGSVLVK